MTEAVILPAIANLENTPTLNVYSEYSLLNSGAGVEKKSNGLSNVIQCPSVVDIMKTVAQLQDHFVPSSSEPTLFTPNGCKEEFFLAEATNALMDGSSLLQQQVRAFLNEGLSSSGNLPENYEQSISVCDLAEVYRQFTRWCRELPMVHPFYAVKCNPDPNIIQLLGKLGTGFDCASKAEMNMVLSLGIDPSRIVYAHPCKPIPHLLFAATNGVRMMTFDNVEELYKIKQYHPKAQVILRIRPDDSRSTMQFGRKFGASLSCVQLLLKKTLELDLEAIGVSFHVGSGCYDAKAYPDAVKLARRVFDEAETLGIGLRLLDIGGGFPGNHPNIFSTEHYVEFESISAALRPTLSQLFPNVQIIAEPGRYFVASALTLACMVTSRRILSGTGLQVDSKEILEDSDGEAKRSFMYYVNDGVYGSFNCIMFDYALPRPEILTINGNYCYDPSQESYSHLQQFNSSVWGPTCDSIDCIIKSRELPELFVGDWLMFKNMGAYTCAVATEFNGFPRSRIMYVATESK